MNGSLRCAADLGFAFNSGQLQRGWIVYGYKEEQKVGERERFLGSGKLKSDPSSLGGDFL